MTQGFSKTDISMMHSFFKTVLMLVLWALPVVFGKSASAADFTFVSGAALPASDNRFDGRTLCNIRMDGEIVDGDAARFDQFLASVADRIEEDPDILGNPRIATLCLDSEGGSLDAAVRIAEAIRKDRPFTMRKGIPFVATRLGANARCESACAIIFMAGTYDDFEGPASPMRSMHPTARLGFHAPALSVPRGDYREVFVSTAYNTSISAIASILRVLNVGADPDGRLYSGSGPWMVAPLLEAMLATPPSQMRYVETVDDAGRWGIPIFPIVQKEFGLRTAYHACINRSAWGRNRPSYTPSELEFGNVSERSVQGSSFDFRVRRLFVVLNELDGEYCEITARENGNASLTLQPDVSAGGVALDRTAPGDTMPVSMGSRAIWFYDANTPLNTLAPEGEAPLPVAQTLSRHFDTAVSDWAPRFGGTKISLWNHNGSQMAWESRGQDRWIWYYRPRDGLRSAGVTEGTLLFEGKLKAGVLWGQGRRFSSTCPDNLYPLAGEVKGTKVVLTGKYRRRNPDCTAGDARNDRLEFEFIATAPVQSGAPDGTAPADLMRITGVRTGLNFRAGPQGSAVKILELPADLSGIQLQSCVPGISALVWQTATPNQQSRMLSENWCSLVYRGRVGYVSGKFLTPVNAN
jgi:hypothetical protein